MKKIGRTYHSGKSQPHVPNLEKGGSFLALGFSFSRREKRRETKNADYLIQFRLLPLCWDCVEPRSIVGEITRVSEGRSCHRYRDLGLINEYLNQRESCMYSTSTSL